MIKFCTHSRLTNTAHKTGSEKPILFYVCLFLLCSVLLILHKNSMQSKKKEKLSVLPKQSTAHSWTAALLVCPQKAPNSQQDLNWNGSWIPSQADWVKLIIFSCHNESISSALHINHRNISHPTEFHTDPFKHHKPWCHSTDCHNIKVKGD